MTGKPWAAPLQVCEWWLGSQGKGRGGDWAPPLRPSNPGDAPPRFPRHSPSQRSAVRYFTLFTATSETARSGHVLQIRKPRLSEATFLAQRLVGLDVARPGQPPELRCAPSCQGSCLAGVGRARCFWRSLSLSLQRGALAGQEAAGRSAH